jgi:hypothetical protein
LSSGVVLPATSGWSPCDVGIGVGCGWPLGLVEQGRQGLRGARIGFVAACDVGVRVGCGPWDSSNRGVTVRMGHASGSSLRVRRSSYRVWPLGLVEQGRHGPHGARIGFVAACA